MDDFFLASRLKKYLKEAYLPEILSGLDIVLHSSAGASIYLEKEKIIGFKVTEEKIIFYKSFALFRNTELQDVKYVTGEWVAKQVIDKSVSIYREWEKNNVQQN